MRQNFLQLDFMDKQDAAGNKNIIVRLVNKDGTHTEYVALWELLNLAKDIEFFKELYATWHKTIKVHAASRKKRLIERLVRRVSKLTAQKEYWRKRATKLASGAIEVEADVPPKKKQKSSMPPENITRGLPVTLASSSGQTVRGIIRSHLEDKMALNVESLLTNANMKFKWNGTQYISEHIDENGDPSFVLFM